VQPPSPGRKSRPFTEYGCSDFLRTLTDSCVTVLRYVIEDGSIQFSVNSELLNICVCVTEKFTIMF
jgi:hypothetical protein